MSSVSEKSLSNWHRSKRKMRAFVVLSFLVVAALARPQYDYNPGPIGIPQVPFQPAQQPGSSYIPPHQGGGHIGGGHIGGGHIGGGHIGGGSIGGGHIPGGHIGGGHIGGSSSFPGHIGGGNGINTAPGHIGGSGINTAPGHIGGGISSPQIGSPIGSHGGHHDEPAQQIHEAPLISKQFYLHSAPEDHDNIGKTKHFVLGRPQKNYRVVFIKAPSDSSANVKLSAEYAPQEEKTVIYVLSQKEHELDVNDIATPAPTQPSKPEVFFIKYKTPEEAAHAQNEIQRQYDVLGGQNQVSDEGHAPVTSVVGALDKPVDNHALNTLGNQYLPSH